MTPLESVSRRSRRTTSPYLVGDGGPIILSNSYGLGYRPSDQPRARPGPRPSGGPRRHPVEESLPFNLSHRKFAALRVRQLPPVPPERELVAVARQVLLAKLVEHAVVPALQQC